MLGRLVQGLTTFKGLLSGYNRDLQATKEPFMEGLRLTRSSLRANIQSAARANRMAKEHVPLSMRTTHATFTEPGASFGLMSPYPVVVMVATTK